MERTLETIKINNALEIVRLKGNLKFKHPFMVWIDRGNSISHKIYKLSECGIEPLALLSYPVRN